MKNNPQNHIVKFPNRRLYCPVEARYITVDEVAQRIKARKPVTVIDKRDGRNITAFILLQILVKQEERGEGRISQEELLKYVVARPVSTAIRSAA